MRFLDDESEIFHLLHFFNLDVLNPTRDVPGNGEHKNNDKEAHERTVEMICQALTQLVIVIAPYLQPRIAYKNHTQRDICKGIYNTAEIAMISASYFMNTQVSYQQIRSPFHH